MRGDIDLVDAAELYNAHLATFINESSCSTKRVVMQCPTADCGDLFQVGINCDNLKEIWATKEAGMK